MVVDWFVPNYLFIRAYLFEQTLFQNKIFRDLDKIYFCFAKIKLSKHTLYKLNWLPD